MVRSPLAEGERHELVVEYSGSPRPEPAPTTRGDFSTVGFTVTDRGEVWTMQEPYGAFSWYPVNDQPSDKALYDITVTCRRRGPASPTVDWSPRPPRATTDDDALAARRARVVVPRDARDR